jgi:hypothetical protein
MRKSKWNLFEDYVQESIEAGHILGSKSILSSIYKEMQMLMR